MIKQIASNVLKDAKNVMLAQVNAQNALKVITLVKEMEILFVVTIVPQIVKYVQSKAQE